MAKRIEASDWDWDDDKPPRKVVLRSKRPHPWAVDGAVWDVVDAETGEVLGTLEREPVDYQPGGMSYGPRAGYVGWWAWPDGVRPKGWAGMSPFRSRQRALQEANWTL